MMRELKQISERYNSRVPGCKEAIEQVVEARYQRLRDLYGDRIVRCERHTLSEMYACEILNVAYLINVWIELSDMPLIVLPDGFLLRY